MIFFKNAWFFSYSFTCSPEDDVLYGASSGLVGLGEGQPGLGAAVPPGAILGTKRGGEETKKKNITQMTRPDTL